MINGDRCTRACGFCQVDTRKPLALDPDEPQRVADAVAALGLAHAVITCVARDDLPDGGASGFAATVARDPRDEPGHRGRAADRRLQGRRRVARRRSSPPGPTCSTTTSRRSPRLQRAVRPSAGYAAFARGARPGPRRRARHEVGADPRHGRDRRRGAGRDGRPARRRRRDPHDRPVPAAVGRAPAGREVVASRRVRGAAASTARRSASRTSSRVRSCARAITPARARIGWFSAPH